MVKTDDFIPVYKAIHATKRKIPARVLRYCKEQLYELVKSAEPEKKICVVDIDEIDTKDDVEFLVGVGVAQQEIIGPSPVGYASIGISELLEDILHENKSFDCDQILGLVAPRTCKHTPYVPVFKYLRELNINSLEEYKASKYKLDKIVLKDIKNYRMKTYSKPFFRHYRHMTMQEIIDNCTPQNACAYIPFLSKDKINLDVLHAFLVENQEKFNNDVSNYASSFRKLAAFYDRLKWGW
ncbi:hypothetical protein ACEUDM_10075 [Aeromonas caviae]|uniref:hypothetical protein n=1 Tax=Aeromonas caviae TaxID=648 RepID=UPI0038CF4737